MSSAKTWFVKAGFGTILGPMPDDALREMVRTGALVRGDEVREGNGGEWQLASETAGLFDNIGTDPAETSAGPRAIEDLELVNSVSRPASKTLGLVPPELPLSPRTADSATSPQIELPATKPKASAILQSEIVADSKVTEAVTSITQSPNEDGSTPQSGPPTNDLIAAWKAERVRSKEELGMVSLAADMNRFHDEEDYAPELPADLLNDDLPETEAAPAPSASVVTSKPAASAATPPNSVPASRATIQRPAFLDQVPGLEDGPRRQVESTTEKPNRLRLSSPVWSLLAVVIVVLLAWWFWPRSQRSIYERYAALWEEWKTRRTDYRDPENWNRFLKRAESELNETVSRLEKHARSSDRETLLLLYIGRDCLQKMLKQPRQIGTQPEQQLQILLASARGLYEPSALVSLGVAGEANGSLPRHDNPPAATGPSSETAIKAPSINEITPKSASPLIIPK